MVVGVGRAVALTVETGLCLVPNADGGFMAGAFMMTGTGGLIVLQTFSRGSKEE